MDRRSLRRQALRARRADPPKTFRPRREKDVTWKSLEARISPQHRDFTRSLLKKYGIELTTTNVADNQPQPFDAQRALELLESRSGIRSG